jgi:hypothetical protein
MSRGYMIHRAQKQLLHCSLVDSSEQHVRRAFDTVHSLVAELMAAHVARLAESGSTFDNSGTRVVALVGMHTLLTRLRQRIVPPDSGSSSGSTPSTALATVPAVANAADSGLNPIDPTTRLTRQQSSVLPLLLGFHSVYLHGAPASGKTHLARYVQGRSQFRHVTVIEEGTDVNSCNCLSCSYGQKIHLIVTNLPPDQGRRKYASIWNDDIRIVTMTAITGPIPSAPAAATPAGQTAAN